MPTPTKGPRLGGGPAHERLILANLATNLFEHKRITTTEAKAKRVRPLAERLITFAKRGDLASRRRALTVVRDKGIVNVLFTEIGPAMAERHGGYTRITKIGPRKGDNAPMAVIELVLEPVSPKQATVREAEKATKRAASKPAKATSAKVEVAGAAEAPVEAPVEAPADAVVEAPVEAPADAVVEAPVDKVDATDAVEGVADEAASNAENTVRGWPWARAQGHPLRRPRALRGPRAAIRAFGARAVARRGAH